MNFNKKNYLVKREKDGRPVHELRCPCVSYHAARLLQLIHRPLLYRLKDRVISATSRAIPRYPTSQGFSGFGFGLSAEMSKKLLNE